MKKQCITDSILQEREHRWDTNSRSFASQFGRLLSLRWLEEIYHSLEEYPKQLLDYDHWALALSLLHFLFTRYFVQEYTKRWHNKRSSHKLVFRKWQLAD